MLTAVLIALLACWSARDIDPPPTEEPSTCIGSVLIVEPNDGGKP
jgi:hypothetical protein